MSDTDDSASNVTFPAPQATPPARIRKRTSAKAVFSFLFGAMGLVLWVFAAIPAIILALWAKIDIRRNPLLDGRGLANAGLALGVVGLVAMPVLLSTCSFVLFRGLPSVMHGDRIAHFHLSGELAEGPQDDPMGMLGGQPNSLASLVDRLQQAQDDSAVKAVILTFDGLALNFAHVEELREALAAFSASGKKVFAHCEEPLVPMRLYMALAATDRLSVAPTALIDLKGFYGEEVYLKDGLAKIGVEADVVQIGDYKSAGEMFTRNGPSNAANDDTNRLFDGLYESSVNMIAVSRHKPPEDVRRLIDAGPYTAERALDAGLIDSVSYQDEFLEQIKNEYGRRIEIDNDYARVPAPEVDPKHPNRSVLNVASYFARLSKPSGGDKIGLIYLEGPIVSGFGEANAAWSGNLRDAFKTAAEDDSVKAVVLRVDSPGGSVTASEVILRAAQELQKNKPLVVSMGSVAASGGYYVSCSADAIFADETTLTGSIGVIGGKMVTTGLWNKLGLNWVPYQRGANADLFSSARRFDERQRAQITEDMLDAYGTFKDHVTAERGKKLTKAIDDLAGGRVYTGKQALDVGLIDKIGGMQAAIAHTAELASLKKYTVQVIPKPQNVAQLIVEAFLGTPHPPSDLEFDSQVHRPGLKPLLGLAGASDATNDAVRALEALDPRHAAVAIEMIRRIQLLQHEGIAMLMPQMLIIE